MYFDIDNICKLLQINVNTSGSRSFIKVFDICMYTPAKLSFVSFPVLLSNLLSIQMVWIWIKWPHPTKQHSAFKGFLTEFCPHTYTKLTRTETAQHKWPWLFCPSIKKDFATIQAWNPWKSSYAKWCHTSSY